MDELSLQVFGQRHRLEVAPNVWFYMNHEMEHPDHVAHEHNFLELAFILKGHARHVTVSGSSALKGGEVYVIPRGAWHAYADCHEMEVVNCLLSPHMLSKELAWLDADPVLGKLLGLRSHGARHKVMEIDFSRAAFEELALQLECLEQIYCKTFEKVELLAGFLPVLNTLRSAVSPEMMALAEDDLEHPAVNRSLKIIQEQMEAEWTLEALAAEIKLNPSYLVRLFRQQVGESPMKYLSGVRAEAAANLLLSSNLRVGEVGERVGWPEPKLFARKFKQHFGLRATQYRKQMLGLLSVVE